LAERNVKLGSVRERAASIADGTERHAFEEDHERHLGPFIAMTRMHGAGGGDIARRVGTLLDWTVLDHEVVELVASHLHIDPAAADILDRNAATWMSDILSSLWPQALVPRQRYTQELRRALQLLAMDGKVILLGHAAHLFLPRDQGLAVRIVADEQDRVARIRARRDVDEARVRREIQQVDRAWAQFVSRSFGRDVSDPLLYDLVLNSSALPVEDLADLVVAAWRLKRARTPAALQKAS
jgi:cytidylate kinase